MKKLMILTMLAGTTMFAAPRVSIGIGIGAPAYPGYYAPAPPVVVAPPPCPGPGYAWIAGYYNPAGIWIPGYWAPPVRGFVAPHYAPRYYARPGFDHGRGWDRGHSRR